MIDTQVAAVGLAALAAGGIAYVFLYPLLSGEAQAEKRQMALVAPSSERRERLAAVSRREQVVQSLKEIEARQKARESAGIEVRLLQAGLDWSKRTFFVVSAVTGVALGVLVLLATGSRLAALGAVFAGGIGLPRWALIYRKRKRVKAFIAELPTAVDVIVRGIRSGLPLNDCIRVVAGEAREPLKSEFRAVVEAQALGLTMPEALRKIYDRVPASEANFFGIVIAIQQKSGGNLSEALGNLSKVLRERRKMRDKVKAMSMEAKASAGIIGVLPFLVAFLTYLSSPDYISLLWTTDTGTFALICAGLWMSLGIFVMKRMISFKV
ncbi:MAG TPA: type II secretion system F family protein [Microvirga sp.]|nr:type II secretion system F family protein [Microvirga sp.]